MKRPNIIYMMADDHASQAISAYGGLLAELAPTPNIDRIAEEGMLLENCFCTNSICTPSRAAIFTGTYSHVNGVYEFTALDHSQPTLPKLLQKAGYQTAHIGKWHLHSNPVGLDYWSLLPGQGRYHDPQFLEMGDESPDGHIKNGKFTTFEGHSTDVVTDKALAYIEDAQSKEKPFALFCHFKAPHDKWQHAERYNDLFADMDIPEPDNLFDDYATRCDAIRTTLQYVGSDWGDQTNYKRETGHLSGDERKKAQYQEYLKRYLRTVRGIDDNVGRILRYLDESGLTEDTIVIYTSDQGFFLGEHGLYDKRFFYEESLRMPFVVRWPGTVPAGTRSDAMVLNIDFAPMLLTAAGSGPDPCMQGRDFGPVLEGRTPQDWREEMYYRYYYSHFETEPHYGIRTKTHKLIYYNRIDQWELFDLTVDPAEMNNIVDGPEHAVLVAELKGRLSAIQKEVRDDPADTGEHPRTGFESK